MKTIRSLGAAVALWSGALAAGGAQAQARVEACIAAPAAEALMLSVSPDALSKVGQLCAASLPPAALLRRSPNAMIGRYAAEADAAWPSAKGAIGTLIGDQASGVLDSDLMRPMISTMIAELIAKDFKPKDCPTIDRILTLIEPLPPRNAAALIVTILQATQKPGKKSSFTVCPMSQPR